ncbi:MAG TPA: pyridoxamine 5'-phosphate oxidase family protein [Solirubrobacteraceae bacterium]|nr:pyridoxamine 5'-phosphate oxidase family protein [Solirubrobacteraceae bacterium]
MPVTWSDADDAVIAGDLTAALAYRTPAGGAVPAVVAPVGLRDRERGTVTFTTSLGFGRKLERIRADPRVALAYHAREHGFAADPRYVLVQGTASFDTTPHQQVLEEVVSPAAERFMGPPQRGAFWDRWLSAYYADRVLVTVAVERVTSWPDARCADPAPGVAGAPAPAGPPPAQDPPAKGTAPRIDAARAARRLRALPHVLLAYTGADGLPVVLPVQIGSAEASGIELLTAAPLPPGGRRAGLLGHRYNAQLIGLESRQHTGWLEVGGDGDARYAPHTESGFRAPANKTLLLLANGFLARQGLRRARRAGTAA